ncbi:hypothetical protein ACMHYB_24505 [Sorangium sp. So ce1128]
MALAGGVLEPDRPEERVVAIPQDGPVRGAALDERAADPAVMRYAPARMLLREEPSGRVVLARDAQPERAGHPDEAAPRVVPQVVHRAVRHLDPHRKAAQIVGGAPAGSADVHPLDQVPVRVVRSRLGAPRASDAPGEPPCVIGTLGRAAHGVRPADDLAGAIALHPPAGPTRVDELDHVARLVALHADRPPQRIGDAPQAPHPIQQPVLAVPRGISG